MMPPNIAAALRRKIAEVTDAEMFEILADVVTTVIADLPTGHTTADVELHDFLSALRDECLTRYQRGDHHSVEPLGHG